MTTRPLLIDEDGKVHRNLSVPLAINVRPVDSEATTILYYCRPSGSDTEGDGSQPYPWATLKHALEQLPWFHNGIRYRIDITGCTESHAGGLVIPPFVAPYEVVTGGFDYSTYYFYATNLEIFAEPQVIETITGAHILSQTIDPVTGMLTVTTDLTMTPHAYRGMPIFGDALGEMAAIADNDATKLYIPYYGWFALTAPLYITEYGAEIINSDVASPKPALSGQGIRTSLLLAGIKMTTANPAVKSFIISDSQLIETLFCRLGGCYLDTNRFFVSFFCNFDGVDGNNGLVTYGAGGFMIENGLMYNGKPAIHGGFVQNNYFYQMVFDTCDPVGGGGGSINIYALLDIENCWFKNARANALEFEGHGNAILSNTIIEDSGGDAISAYNPGMLKLTNVHGDGNVGVGLRIANGCQVQVGTTDVTGASDYKVGGNAAGTWLGFGGNEVDANSFSRLFS